MRGRKSIYQNRRRRMLIIDAVGAVIGLVLYFTGVYELWFVLFILFLFCWIIYILFGPGMIIGRVYRIQKERDIRELRELNEQWYKDNKGFCDRATDKECEEFFNRPPYCNDMTGSSRSFQEWDEETNWD